MVKQQKETNPKDAVGVLKAYESTVPSCVIMEAGVALYEGARKYGRHNYRVAGVRASVYYDGAQRHLKQWWDEGEDLDPDSSDSPELRLNHITKAIASLIVLRDAMINDKWIDDRPPPCKPGFIRSLDAKVKAIAEKYPNAKPAYVAGDTALDKG